MKITIRKQNTRTGERHDPSGALVYAEQKLEY
jgi:hypothetical protein